MKKKLSIVLAVICSMIASFALVACDAPSTEPPHEHSYNATTTNPTCTTDGSTLHTCACGDQYTTPIPATGHTITHSELVAPTCTLSGTKEYWYCPDCNVKWKDENGINQYGSNESVYISPLDHQLGNPVWTWDGYTSASLKLTCLHDDCEYYYDLNTSNIYSYTTRYANCTENGEREYIASVYYNNQEYTDTVTETIPAYNHSYGEPTWNWSSYKDNATAMFVCENDSDHFLDLTAEIESEVTIAPTCHSYGQTTYTATVVLGNETYTDVVTAYDVDRIAHTLTVDEDSWNWYYHWSSNEVENYESLYTAKVDIVCSVSECYYSSTVDANVSAEMTTAVECTTDGEATFTASYDIDGTSFSVTKTHTIRYKGHTYVDSNVCTTCDYHALSVSNGSANGEDFWWVTGIYNYQSVMTKMYIPAVIGGKPVRVSTFSPYSSYANITDIYIEEGVKYVSLDSLARSGWNSLENVYIPSTVETLSYTYYNSEDIATHLNEYENGYYIGTIDNPYFALVTVEDNTITEFNLHEDTVMICELAFGCDKSNFKFESLTTVNLNKNVKDIPTKLFRECVALETINIDSENAYLTNYDGVVYDKDITTILAIPKKISGDVVIPDSVTSPIPDNAFKNSLITSIVIGDGVPSVGSGAFNECTLLASAVIGDSVVTLGTPYVPNSASTANYAFNWCESLEYLSIGKSVQEFHTTMHYDKTTGAGLKVLNVESLENFINYNKFGIGFTFEHKHVTLQVKDEKITTLVVPEGITEYNTSINMFDILHVVMPSTLQSIGASTFNNNRVLLTINIPASVTTIGQYAFGGCKSALVYCEAESKPAGWHDWWNNDVNYGRCLTFWGAPTDLYYDGESYTCIIEKDDMIFILDKENKTASFYNRQSQALKGDENGVFTVPVQINYEGTLYTVTKTLGSAIDSTYITKVRVSNRFTGSLVADPYYYDIEFLGSQEEFTAIYGTYYNRYIESGKITFIK